ncbi:MAG: FMN-binding protein [Peptoniphilus sp.]|nr:FMN-binding protein [Peptoniphilus sp.]MDD7363270.1 FMN-binding protein [Bacillota bacterium]MDY6045363.1 FMN-binding protein [Peptoniphilus sp.]
MKKLLLGLAACLLLTGCSSSVSYSAKEPVHGEKRALPVDERMEDRRLLHDGIYVSQGRGMQGDISIEMRVRDGYIDSVRVTEHEENVGVVEDAFEQLQDKVIRKQSADVDTVSGATEASYGFLEAVKNCIREAE